MQNRVHRLNIRMDAVYLRHELLRHEHIRLSTFFGSSVPGAAHLAESGFYYDKDLGRLVCFSCNLTLKAKFKDLFRFHYELSLYCEFINGKDVSIKCGTN